MRVIIQPPNDAFVDDDNILSELFFEHQGSDLVVDFAGKRSPVPCAACLIEIVVFVGASMAAGAIAHYTSKLLNVLDKSIKEKYDEWNISFTDGESYTNADVRRNDLDGSKEEVIRVLRELETINRKIESQIKDED